MSVDKINYDYTEGLKYELNSDKTGYIVTGSAAVVDGVLECVTADKASTIAVHCVYNGLPVVGISSLYTVTGIYSGYSYTSIRDDIRKVIIPESVMYASLGSLTNLSAIEVVANNENLTSVDNVLYSKDMSALILYPRKKSGTYFSVPNTVKEINSGAFSSCVSLQTVNLPYGLEKIGDGVFNNCKNINSISIPDSLISFGSMNSLYSIEDTFGVMPMLKVESNGCYLGNSSNPYMVFVCCRYINENVTINSRTKIIASYPFVTLGISNSTLDIPDSVMYIGDHAFSHICYGSGNTGKVINIGSGVVEIGESPFGDNSNMYISAINVASGNKYYSSKDGVFYNKQKTELIYYPNSKADAEFSIDSSVNTINDYAFYNCSSLTSIEIPSSVTSIGDYAFYNCSSLSSIEIPSSITGISDRVFYGCSSLTSIEIPSSVTSIGTYAFHGCSNLTSVEIPSSVTNMGDYVFYNCRSLTSIEIPSSVTSIGSYLFYGCSNLTIYCEAESQPIEWDSSWSRLNRTKDIPVVWGYKG